MDTKGTEVRTEAGTGTRDTVLAAAGRTAIARSKPSVPARKLVASGHLLLGDMILDYGCGKSKDVEYFRDRGYVAFGYDPVYEPYMYPKLPYNWVFCAYVLNVLPHPDRGVAVNNIFNILPEYGNAFFAVRAAKEVNREIKDTWTAQHDGWLTSAGTFQKGFTAPELKDFLRFYGFKRFNVESHDPLIVAAHKWR